MRRDDAAMPVLALLGLVLTILYWPARRCGVISDAWELLGIADRGLPEALFASLGYHVIPVTHFVSTILWKTFGLWEPGYQLANLGELLLVAWGVYFLGLRLFGRPLVALLASLLLLANASFYELTMWPVIGNFQFVAALLQLAGLYAVHRAIRGEKSLRWLLMFGLAAVLSFFTYEPAISLLPAGVIYAALIPPEGGDRSWRQMWARSRGLLVVSVVALAPMLVSKALAVRAGNTAFFLPSYGSDVALRLHYVVRAVLGIVTLRGSDGPTHALFYGFCPAPAIFSHRHYATIVAWLAVLGIATLFALFRSRQPAIPFLLLWFWDYVFVTSVATTMQSRMYLLAAMPAALLMAWGIFRVCDRLGSMTGREPAAVSATLAFVTFGLLAAGAKSDIDDVAALHREATVAARRIREIVEPRALSVDEVALVNLPGKIVRDGMGAYAFVNGTWPMMRLALHGALPPERLKLYTTSATVEPGRYANGTVPIDVAALARKMADSRAIVLVFDERNNTIVELGARGSPATGDASPATSHLLDR
ncbi:MAG: glycosyltransferase family 39 protein [Thermoanaerobaculia bacterium]|jgi:hypothetical protein